MRVVLGLILGISCAAIIACGAASKKSAAVAPGAELGGGANHRHAQIDELDKQIDDGMKQMNLPRPSVPPGTCAPSCPMPAAASVNVRSTDAACHPGPSDACKDSCKFSDSICENAGRICDIAKQLGGNDAYANDKCTSGNASCEASHAQCCSCQL